MKTLATWKSALSIVLKVQIDYSASPDVVRANPTTRIVEALASLKMLTSLIVSCPLLEGSSRLGGSSLKMRCGKKGWLAIAELKPLSLLISLLLMLKKAFDNVKIDKWKVKVASA